MNRDTVSVKLDDTYALHLRRGYPARASVANSYRCSIGPRPGEAFVLMDKRNATRLSSRSSHSLEFHSAGSGVTLDIEELYWHSAVKLSAGVGDNALYLIRLYDKRILACRYSDSQTVLANVRGGAIAYTSPYVAGSGETWQDVVDALWPSILGTAPTLPYSPVAEPEGQWHGQNAWWALHSVLSAIGCTTVYDPTTAEFSIVRVGEAQTWEEPEIPIWDADPIGGKLDAPATIAGYFSDWSEQHGTEPETLTAGSNYIETPPYGRETLATGAEAVDGTVLPRWAPFPQVSSYEGTDRNSGDRTDWLNQEKLNILNDTSTPRRHKQFNGVHKILPGSEIKTVQWHHRGECGGMVTEYASHPGDPLPGGSGTALDCYAPAYAEQNWQVPTFAAAGYPTWPRVMQVVKIDHASTSAGVFVSPNADELHPGKLVIHAYDGETVGEDVWVRIVNHFGTLSGDVDSIQGQRYIARLAGMAVSGGTKKPLYLAYRGRAKYFGKVATEISAASGTTTRTLGSGTVTLYKNSGTSGTSLSTTKTAYNTMLSVVAVDTFVHVEEFDPSGDLFVTAVDCGA